MPKSPSCVEMCEQKWSEYHFHGEDASSPFGLEVVLGRKRDQDWQFRRFSGVLSAAVIRLL